MRAPPVCGSCPARHSRARGGLGLRTARRTLCTGLPERRVAAVGCGPTLSGQVRRRGVFFWRPLGAKWAAGAGRPEKMAGPGLGARLRQRKQRAAGSTKLPPCCSSGLSPRVTEGPCRPLPTLCSPQHCSHHPSPRVVQCEGSAVPGCDLGVGAMGRDPTAITGPVALHQYDPHQPPELH